MKQRSEMGRCNFFAMTCHTIIGFVLTAAYGIETFVKGERAAWYFLIVVLMGLGPVIMEQIAFKKNNDTTMVKHFLGYGYALFYIFLVFTATNPLTFTYAMPMILIISVYNDIVYSLKINIGCIIVNIAQIIIGASTHSLGYTNMAGAEIQIALVIMMAVFSVILSNVLSKNSKAKLDVISEQKEKDELKFNETLEIVSKMTSDINDMYEKVVAVLDTANYTKTAMSEVTKGTTDTSNAVSNQLLQTQQIQDNLTEVDTAAATLLSEMNVTKDEIEAGRVNMSDMVSKVNASVETGKEVAGQLETLDEKINEMNSIGIKVLF